MKTIFNYTDYKEWVRDTVNVAGRGAYSRIAECLRVNTSMVSQIFKGDKDLNAESAFEIAGLFGLSSDETEYFLALVDYGRAGSAKLRSFRLQTLHAIRGRNQEVVRHLPSSKELSDSDKTIFYSQWYYSAIALICGIPGINSAHDISKALTLPLEKVRKALDFLISKSLVVQKNGGLFMGTARTHVPQSSPLSTRHHANWRVQVLPRMENISREELMFTSPMTLSAVDAARVRALLIQAIGEVSKVVDPSPSEELWCFNLDLVRLHPNDCK